MAAKVCRLDGETFSESPIKFGLPRYFSPEANPLLLMLAYQIDDKQVKLWQPDLEPIPEDLAEVLNDDRVTLYAWNALFEWYIVNYLIEIPVPITRFKDPMIMALRASLPPALGKVGPILGIDAEQLKNTAGTRLINKFSKPRNPTKDKPYTRCTRDTDPEDWQAFCEYCIQDVIAEREIYKRLKPFDLTPEEWADWHLDQQINLRGLPVDMDLVNAAIALDAEEKERLKGKLVEMTGLVNPNSTAQFLPWARERGYPFKSLDKEHIAKFLKQEAEK